MLELLCQPALCVEQTTQNLSLQFLLTCVFPTVWGIHNVYSPHCVHMCGEYTCVHSVFSVH